jgi:phosphatidylglycerophosphate synthase
MLIYWGLLSIIIVVLIVFREPNVESVGALIQESITKEEEPARLIDIILIVMMLFYMGLTMEVI